MHIFLERNTHNADQGACRSCASYGDNTRQPQSNTNVSFDSGCGKLRQLRLSRKNTLSSTNEWTGRVHWEDCRWKELLDASYKTRQARGACRHQKLADYYWCNLTKPARQADRRTGISCTSCVTSDVEMKKNSDKLKTRVSDLWPWAEGCWADFSVYRWSQSRVDVMAMFGPSRELMDARRRNNFWGSHYCAASYNVWA